MEQPVTKEEERRTGERIEAPKPKPTRTPVPREDQPEPTTED